MKKEQLIPPKHLTNSQYLSDLHTWLDTLADKYYEDSNPESMACARNLRNAAYIVLAFCVVNIDKSKTL